MIELQKAYPFTNWKQSGSFHSYAIMYRADSLIARRDYRQSIETLSEAYDLFIPAWVNKLLCLRLYVGDDIEGRDLLFLRGVPKITYWGRENWKLMVETANKFLGDKRKEIGHAILPNWVNESKTALGKWNPLWKTCQLFHGVTDKFQTSIPYYYFDYVSPFSLSVKDISRDIENIARENRGLPKIGEGWVSETELYYAIKDAFPQFKVVHHASPQWLGRQHLDVYIPEKQVALEFQGEQHDKPIEFFGGEETFRATRERDIRKSRLCEKHGVRLVYVRAGYSLEDIIREIEEQVSTPSS